MAERLRALVFRVPGIPVPEGATNPAQVKRYTALVQWRNDIAVLAGAARRGRWTPVQPPECVRVYATFYLPRPKSGPWADAVFPGMPPDGDKLERALGDAMKTAGVYADDAQIVDWIASKRFAGPDAEPGVSVTVFVATGDGR